MTTITVNGEDIKVELDRDIIRITNDDQLSALLAHNTEKVTLSLVAAIKEAYNNLYKKELDISDASMAVEIWGHVYTDKFAEAIKSISSFDFIDMLAEKIIERCEVIDIGETSRDGNRFFWNALAPLKSAIAALLPKK